MRSYTGGLARKNVAEEVFSQPSPQTTDLDSSDSTSLPVVSAVFCKITDAFNGGLRVTPRIGRRTSSPAGAPSNDGVLSSRPPNMVVRFSVEWEGFPGPAHYKRRGLTPPNEK